MSKTADFSVIEAGIREIYGSGPVGLHLPFFFGTEIELIRQVIDSEFVSGGGPVAQQFEEELAARLGDSVYVASVASGTAALHLALLSVGVVEDTEVITQGLSFIATFNAIRYCNAKPIFLDVSPSSFSLCAERLEQFLTENCVLTDDSITLNKRTGKRISACLPVHVLGQPGFTQELKTICDQWHIPIVEDSAEGLGSYRNHLHVGLVGDVGVLSFNANKIITAGGGGAVFSRSESRIKKIKHLASTAKIDHPWCFQHDKLGFNYRMSDLLCGFGLAQLRKLELILERKRKIADQYQSYFNEIIDCNVFSRRDFGEVTFNNWLNYIFVQPDEKNKLLEYLNRNSISARPLWNLGAQQVYLKEYESHNLDVCDYLIHRIICLPSGYTPD